MRISTEIVHLETESFRAEMGVKETVLNKQTQEFWLSMIS